jgi:hypothetical protein
VKHRIVALGHASAACETRQQGVECRVSRGGGRGGRRTGHGADSDAAGPPSGPGGAALPTRHRQSERPRRTRRRRRRAAGTSVTGTPPRLASRSRLSHGSRRPPGPCPTVTGASESESDGSSCQCTTRRYCHAEQAHWQATVLPLLVIARPAANLSLKSAGESAPTELNLNFNRDP